MPLFASNRVLIFSGLAALVVLSGRNSSGQAPDDQVASRGSASTARRKAPPLGLGLGHASNEEVLERIVDRSRGHAPVDPYTLHPPALSPDSNDRFTWHEPKPYTCWVVEAGEDDDDYAPGTAVACYVKVTLADGFVNGDGSLAGNAAGKPDDFFGFDCLQGFSVKDFAKDRWRAVRYFDRNLNHMGTIRSAKYDGINYNFTTGKSVAFHADFIEINVMNPVDGTADHEYTKFLGSDWGPIIGADGRVLANSFGRIDFTPHFGAILYQDGSHPFDAFYFGDPSGVAPVCDALK